MKKNIAKIHIAGINYRVFMDILCPDDMRVEDVKNMAIGQLLNIKKDDIDITIYEEKGE